VKLFWEASSEANNSSSMKVALDLTGEDTGQFSAGPIDKAVSSYNEVDRVIDSWWWTFWAFTVTHRSVHTSGVCSVLDVQAIS